MKIVLLLPVLFLLASCSNYDPNIQNSPANQSIDSPATGSPNAPAIGPLG